MDKRKAPSRRIRTTFADYVKAYLVNGGNGAELGRRVGVSRNAIMQLSRGKVEPQLGTAIKIAKELRFSLDSVELKQTDEAFFTDPRQMSLF